jgi:hypothetical protein
MRKYIVLEKAVTMGSCDNLIRRIIIYETEKEGVYIFLSSSEDDIGCDADYWFEDVKSAEIYCKDYGIQQNDCRTIGLKQRILYQIVKMILSAPFG